MVEKSGKRNAFVTRGRHVSKRWRTFDNNQREVAVSNIVRKQNTKSFYCERKGCNISICMIEGYSYTKLCGTHSCL